MARGTGGIDQQVTALADAYRDNPMALQKNHEINKNLMALLALQKLKAEKEAAEREIAMSQDPASKTVAQQRADEAIGRSQKEVAEQVGGIAQLQNRKGQQNLRRMAAGAPPANQPAQMAGIANQPAPNMVRMAKGGIVSFAEGSEEPIRAGAWEKLFEEIGFEGGMDRFRALSPSHQNRIIADINSRRARRRPDLLDRGMAWAGDVVSSPVRAGVDLVAPAMRHAGMLEGQALSEGDQWAFTHGMNRQAAENQPISMQNLIPPVADRQPPGMTPEDTRNIPRADPGRPPVVTDPFAPAVDPNQNIPDRSLPVPSMGAEDTTAVADFVTPQTRIAKERNFELDRAQARMLGMLPGLEARMGQDRTAAGATAQGAADVHLNRKGVAAAHRDMLAREEAFQKSQEAARRPHLDVLAGARGAGAFADIGRSAAFGRREAAMGRERDFRGLQSLRQGQLDADLNIAKESLAAGQKTEELTQSDIENATTNNRAVMADLEGSISKEADRGLKIDELNMNAEQWEAQIRFDKALAKLKSSTQVIVAEYNGKIRARGQDIQLRAIESDDRNTIMQGIEATDRMITDIRAGIEAAVQEAIKDELLNSDYMDMNATEKANHKNQIRIDISEAFEAQIVSQQALRKRLRLKFEGAIEGMRNPTGSYAEEITPAP